jgi:hypothetical protein
MQWSKTNISEKPENFFNTFKTVLEINPNFKFVIIFSNTQFAASLFKDVAIRCQWNIRGIRIKWSGEQKIDKKVPIIFYTRGDNKFKFQVILTETPSNNLTEVEISNN